MAGASGRGTLTPASMMMMMMMMMMLAVYLANTAVSKAHGDLDL